ncbi:circadian clock-controlled protein daywake [Leptinotarsa decemlineata]|uniref:circadian clock-controlled protein daywake n=1 Tax=Leptinotarsa decemlineata TaxID=7539 RepID=UPI003D30D5CC
MGLTLIFCILMCLFGSYNSKTLPSHFPRCHRFDKNLEQCLLDATETLKSTIGEGVPSLRLPRFEPFFLKEVTVDQGTKAVNFKAILEDILIHNLTTYNFTRFHFDVPNLEIVGECSFKELRLEGKYSVHGKILVVPIEGVGNLTVSLDDCSVKLYQKFKIQKRKGSEYLVPISTNGSLTVGATRAQLDGLFGGNEKLGNFTNNFINENMDELIKEMQPVLNRVISTIVENLVFKIVSNHISYDELFPK